jgi:hypothetical protein
MFGTTSSKTRSTITLASADLESTNIKVNAACWASATDINNLRGRAALLEAARDLCGSRSSARTNLGTFSDENGPVVW